jgi:hypothetical protein
MRSLRGKNLAMRHGFDSWAACLAVDDGDEAKRSWQMAGGAYLTNDSTQGCSKSSERARRALTNRIRSLSKGQQLAIDIYISSFYKE